MVLWAVAREWMTLTPAYSQPKLVAVGGHVSHRRKCLRVDERCTVDIMKRAVYPSSTSLPVVIQPHVVVTEIKKARWLARYLARPCRHPVHCHGHFGLIHIAAIAVPRSPPHSTQKQQLFSEAANHAMQARYRSTSHNRLTIRRQKGEIDRVVSSTAVCGRGHCRWSAMSAPQV